MNIVPRASHWDELIRPDRVHGSLYNDPAIFEAELQNIWYRTWVYVGHESEVPNANDYVAKSIGPQSIIMTRDEQGKINLLLNRCSHRGNQVCSYDKGNARSFTCPFHSWTFANDGRLVGYAFPDGYEGTDKARLGLGRVTRVQSYRGFVFGSFAAEGPSLREHLGGAAETIDRAAMPLPEAVARTHPDGIDVLVDVASDAAQFAALAGHVRPGGTAVTTRYIADPETLARAGVTGVNFQLSMTVPLLDRLASRVAAGSIVPPSITRVSLDDVPALLGGRGAEGKTVITM